MFYEVFQNAIVQLLVSRWLKIINEGYGSKKLAITEKGMIFLEKYIELQKIVGLNNELKPTMLAPKTKTCPQ